MRYSMNTFIIYMEVSTQGLTRQFSQFGTISLWHIQFPFGINIIPFSGDRKDKSSQEQNWQPDVTTPSQEDDQ